MLVIKTKNNKYLTSIIFSTFLNHTILKVLSPLIPVNKDLEEFTSEKEVLSGTISLKKCL